MKAILNRKCYLICQSYFIYSASRTLGNSGVLFFFIFFCNLFKLYSYKRHKSKQT